MENQNAVTVYRGTNTHYIHRKHEEKRENKEYDSKVEYYKFEHDGKKRKLNGERKQTNQKNR